MEEVRFHGFSHLFVERIFLSMRPPSTNVHRRHWRLSSEASQRIADSCSKHRVGAWVLDFVTRARSNKQPWQQIRLHLLLHLHLSMLDVSTEEIFELADVNWGLPAFGRAGPSKEKRARRGLPPCQEKGQGGAIPAVSVDVVNLNGQNECLLTVR